MKKILTLCIIHRHPQVLLGMKKRGFGAGRWNGFGGKVEAGESVEDAARREIWEEAGLKVSNFEQAGKIDFEFMGDPVALEVNIFKTSDFDGEPVETEEMKPQWFNTDEIPFDKMWPDDKYWLPLFLEGKKFSGRFLFSAEGGPASGGEVRIIEHKLEILDA